MAWRLSEEKKPRVSQTDVTVVHVFKMLSKSFDKSALKFEIFQFFYFQFDITISAILNNKMKSMVSGLTLTECFTQASVYVETLDIFTEVLLTKLPRSKRSKIFAL